MDLHKFYYFCYFKLPFALQKVSLEQSVTAIRVSMVIQAFCPAQILVSVDRKIARNPLLLLHSTVRLSKNPFPLMFINNLIVNNLLKIYLFI